MKTTMTTNFNLLKLSSNLIFGVVTLTLFLTSNTTFGQQKQNDNISVKGIVKDAEGILFGANIILKGTSIGTSSNKKGEFSFPKKVNAGDVLIVSFLGYKKQEFKITKETTFLNVLMLEDDSIIAGSLGTDVPYNSKRTKN